MSERLYYSPSEIFQFMNQIGYPIDEKDIVEVYPNYHKNRRVFRVVGEPVDAVYKVRPSGSDTAVEISKLTKLFGCYRFNGVAAPSITATHLEQSQFSVIQMPYVGIDLRYLKEALDLHELGLATDETLLFRGFDSYQISALLDNLFHSHMQFAYRYGLIHGDIFVQGSVNNILYHPDKNRLLFIDAEALTPYHSTSFFAFEHAFEEVERWFYGSLLRTD